MKWLSKQLFLDLALDQCEKLLMQLLVQRREDGKG
jgi:hypothetical protein